MTDKKISELTNLTGANVADDDEFAIVDTSAVETKAITASELRTAIGNGNFTVTGNLTVQGTTVTIDSASAQTVDLGDNDKIRLGDGDDLQIYHDGNHSKIVEAGTGVLEIQTNGSEIQVTGGSGTEYLARFINNGAFQAYYDNSLKLATTSTGIDVTGTVTADGLTVDTTTTVIQKTGDNPTLQFKGHAGSQNTIGEIQSGRAEFSGTNSFMRFKTNDGTSTKTRLNIDDGGDISFYEDTGTTPKFFWDASAESLGIGTTSPSAKLNVVGSAADNGISIKSGGNGGVDPFKVTWSGGTEGDMFIVDDSGRVGIGTSSPSNKLDIKGTVGFEATNSTNEWLAYTYTDNTFRLNYNGAGADEFVIESGGNVGIGTSNPIADLSIVDSSTGSGIEIQPEVTTNTNRITNFDRVESAYKKFRLDASEQQFYISGTERMRIDSSGNVMIGTTTAGVSGGGEQLTVDNASGNAGISIRSNGTGNGNIYFSDNTTGTGQYAGNLRYDHNTNAMMFNTNSTERMRIDSNGLVGIGTTAPTSNGGVTAKVMHMHNASGNDWSINHWTSSATGAAGGDGFIAGVIGSDAYLYNYEASNMIFATNSSEAMRIDSSGNVLVGVTSSSANMAGIELAGNGQLYASTSSSSGHFFNRQSTDGDIVSFRKDGTTVGSIGSIAGAYLNIGSTGGAGAHIGLWNGSVRPTTSAGGNLDNTLDLGDTGARWRNVYVGGGIEIESGTGNVGVGKQALNSNTASENAAFGYQSLYTNTTGTRNQAFGTYAMYHNSTGSYNTAVGRAALINNTTASNNTAVGYEAAYSNTTGDYNAAFGRMSLNNNTTGVQNTALGNAALIAGTTGNYNVAVGSQALVSNTTASNNVAVGYLASYSNTTGTSNVAVGTSALQSSSTANNNTAVGYQAGYSNTTGAQNTFIGRVASYSNTTGNYNTSVGSSALYSNTTGRFNTAIGADTLNLNTTGEYNDAFGHAALDANTTGYSNVSVGSNSLTSNTTGFANTAVGRAAGESNTTASYNVAVGYYAFEDNTIGEKNTALGTYANRKNTTGNYNTSVGYTALFSNTTASENVAVGYQSLYTNTTGNKLVAVGYQAGYSNTTGTYNQFFGERAGYSNTTGSFNSYMGQGAGYYITTGTKNTIIGRYSGNQGGLDIRTSSNNIVLSDGDGNPHWKYVDGYRSGLGGWCSTSADPDMTGANNTTNFGAHLGADGFHEFKRNAALVARFAIQGVTGTIIEFRQNGSARGSISTNGSSTSYNTTSDHRLKENVVDLTGATTRLKQLEPKRFNFISDADTTVDGFLAHEVQTVVPEAITGTHNEVDGDGNPVYQGIDQSKLVPLLVATIKELEARITALENA